MPTAIDHDRIGIYRSTTHRSEPF